MQIFVKTPTGKIIQLDMEGEDKIEDVMANIQNEVGIPPRQQILAFERMLLRHHHTLNRYGIKKETTLHLMPTAALMLPPVLPITRCRKTRFRKLKPPPASPVELD